MPQLRIGISGWTYPPWRGTFYPKGWTQKRELEYASRQVNSIEINGTFYSLQRPKSYSAWYEATPEDFCFSVKCPRFITHIKRLDDVAEPLANFFASGVFLLKEKLGPLLWQLPPSFHYDRDRLAKFFKQLPRDTKAAARIARKHGGRLTGRTHLKIDESRPLQHTLEVRHASFATAEFIELLREFNVGLVVADTAGKWPFMEDITADLVYLRLHGDSELYVSGYTEEALTAWARKIRAWSRGVTPSGARLHAKKPVRKHPHDVFVYFDNDVKVRAPYDAMNLAHRLGLCPAPSKPPKASEISEEPRRTWRGFTSKSARK